MDVKPGILCPVKKGGTDGDEEAMSRHDFSGRGKVAA